MAAHASPPGQVDNRLPNTLAAAAHSHPTTHTQEANDRNVASGVLGEKGLQNCVVETFVMLDNGPRQQDFTVPEAASVVQEEQTPLHQPQQQKSSRLATESAQKMGNMLYKGRVAGQRDPLTLLHLPADVLELIIKKITHTNDLCALSLTCSALHAFAIPHIYSRFDIVWPDSSAQLDPKSGVDALTYGLSTLVMAEEIFGEAPAQQQQPVRCEACGHLNLPRPQQPPDDRQRPDSERSLGDTIRRRRRYGNHYAQYCRKFSLGNGPKEWVQDYMISKEAGKLLGTQVALAVARMRNLESFVWDMPTGVLHEVWMALASLDGHYDGRPCRLERIWIRWHNNAQLLSEADEENDAENSPTSAAMQPNSSRCEHPTFSILPPLKSLSVVDIDEIDYLDDMAALIGRSRHCLRELRVGIAAYIWQSSTIADRHLMAKLQGDSRPARMGGVLGTLFAQVFSVTSGGISRVPETQQSEGDVAGRPAKANNSLSQSKTATDSTSEPSDPSPQGEAAPSASSPPHPTSFAARQATGPASSSGPEHPSLLSNKHKLPTRSKATGDSLSRPQGERLPLEVLELERVPLSVFTMREAIDWSRLTEITLLDCAKHERFWRALRRQFSRPFSRLSSWHPGDSSEALQSPSFSRSSFAADEASCALNLRKIHVNAVSPALICFIRDTLAPHTLQTLFLHASFDTEAIYNVGGTRHVSLDDIYRGAVRRHARSLLKLSIDSGMRSPETRTTPSLALTRKAWTLTRDVLAFLTSGSMRALRELSVCLDHRDWHFFLQRLPCLYHLQSLYIPQILDRSTKRPIASEPGSSGLGSAREFAQQVLDIIVLRPEVQLCYLGMFDKCFELLEGAAPASSVRDSDDDDDDDDDDNDDHDDDNDDNDDEDDDQHEDDEEEEQGHDEDEDDDGGHAHEQQVESEDEEDDMLSDDDNQGPSTHHLAGDSATEDDNDDDDDDDGHGGAHGQTQRRRSHGHHLHNQTAVWLREILFYDDKVAVFRARLGRL